MMKIAFVSVEDPADRHAWSGTITGMFDALKDAGADVSVFTGLSASRSTRLRTGFLKLIIKKVWKTTYYRVRHPRHVLDLARQIERRLKGEKFDFIFAPSSIPVSELDVDTPIAFWTDATFDGMIDFYPGFDTLSKIGRQHGRAQEQRAISRATLAVYASDWAAGTALEHYVVDPQKVHVIGLGANLPAPPAPLDLQARMSGKPILLHIGIDWTRKGGDKAVAATQSLRDRGIDAELHIVGTTPPHPLPDWVVLHGFLSKKDPGQWQELSSLLASSRFLIVPTVAECFGVVFVEAAAFGLPSIGTRVGGVTSAIEEDVTGFLMAPDATGADYADKLEPYFRSQDEYDRLCESALAAYEERLAWKNRGRELLALMEKSLGRSST